MSKKEQLHELIHSLSKSEKRYFWLFCKKESREGNYLKLFDAIEKQEVYNEKAIKNKFKNENFIRQLHVTKNYLHKLILKSLRNYHAAISKDAELKDVLRNIEILYNKELYQHCKAELKVAETIAGKHELLTGKVEVEAWKRKLEQTLQPHAYIAFKSTLNCQREAIELLLNMNDYWQLAVDVAGGMFGDNKGARINSKLLDDPEKARTIEAKTLFYNTNYLLDIQKDKGILATERLVALIGLLKQHPERINEEPGLYVSTINNLLSFFVFNKRYDEALTLIRKARTVYDSWKITASNRTLLKQVLRTYNIELEIYRDSGSFNENPEFIEKTEAFIKTNAQKIPKDYLVSFWFQLASIHFMRKDFSRALQWVNRILNARFKGIRTDIQVQAQMLNLMIHLEQQNLMVLRYYVDSTRRYLKKVNHARPFEEILLKFFIKISSMPLLEYKEAFNELKEKLFPENNEALAPDDALGYIDYERWIDEKSRTKVKGNF